MIALVLAAAMFSATPATLSTTLAQAGCGDGVVLKPGNYGEVVISHRSCTKPMLLDTRAATLALRVQDVEGLTIRGGTFDAAASANGRGVSIDTSSRVQLLGAKVDGAADAITIARSSDVTVRDAVTSRVIGNGVTIAGSQRVTIRGLTCNDATPDPTGEIHPDCVQGWSLPGRITADVLITRVEMSGPTQGIWFGAEPGGYDRITISYSHFATYDAPNGIGLRDCRDCLVIGNRVSTLPGSRWQTTIAALGGSVSTKGNVVAAYGRWPKQDKLLAAADDRYLASRAPTIDNIVASGVPEPSTWGLMIVSIAGVCYSLRRRHCHRSRAAQRESG